MAARRVARRSVARTNPEADVSADPGAESVLTGASEVDRVRAVLALAGVPWHELDDGVQEVRLRLLAGRSTPGRAVIRDPGAWAAVVATRVAMDGHRARARDESLRGRLARRWRTGTPADQAAGQVAGQAPEEERVFALAVLRGLEQLSESQRRLIVLRFYVDLPVGQIAQELSVPVGTVKSRLHTALVALRRALIALEVIDP